MEYKKLFCISTYQSNVLTNLAEETLLTDP